MVLVPFTVTDHYGKTILGLQAKDFDISNDQNHRQIASFGAEDAPCSVGLVLDASGSMRGMLEAAKRGARNFVRTANPEDEFLLLTVSTFPGAESQFESADKVLEENIGFLRPGGFTALVDTIYLGLHRMREARHSRRALIILSDGVDNNSRYSRGELVRAALEADVQIYTIAMDNPAAIGSTNTVPYRPALARKPWDRGPEQQGRGLLEELAKKSGGLYFQARNSAQTEDSGRRRVKPCATSM